MIAASLSASEAALDAVQEIVKRGEQKTQTDNPCDPLL
jgi:hypothetical protein